MARMGVGRCCCSNYLYTSSSFIRMHKLIGTMDRETTQVVLDAAPPPYSAGFGSAFFAVDYTNSLIFTGSPGATYSSAKIYSLTPELEHPTLIYTHSPENNLFIHAVDDINERIYFRPQIGTPTIWRVNYDGTGETLLYTVTNYSGYQATVMNWIACAPTASLIFWWERRTEVVTGPSSPPSEARIMSAALDGTGATEIVPWGSVGQSSGRLVVDHGHSKLWYVDIPNSGVQRIRYCDFDGGNLTTWKTSPGTSYSYAGTGLMVSRKDDRIYWGQAATVGLTWDDPGAVLYSDTIDQDDKKIITVSKVGGVPAGANGVELGEYMMLGKNFEKFG